MFKASLASLVGVVIGLAVAAWVAETAPEGGAESACCKVPKSDD